MIELDGKVRLTKSELNRLRRDAARHGQAIGPIHAAEDYQAALVAACSPALLEDLLEALETGSSRLIRGEMTHDELIG